MILGEFGVLLGVLSSGVFAQSTSCGVVGGFAIRVPNSCPSDASVFCGTGLQTRCCPNGFACFDGKYCCQDGQDCEVAIENHPQCAVSTESVWAYNGNGSLGWCCAANYFGFALVDNSGVGCQPVGQTIDTNSYHTVSQLAVKPVTCSTTSSTSTTSTRSTSTSSQTSSSVSATSTSNGASSSPLPEVTKSSSFGPGAIAGVVIGAVGAIILIALGAWCIGRRSKKRKAATAIAAGHSAYTQSHGYYPQSGNPTKQQPGSTLPYFDVPVQEIGTYEPRTHRVPGTHEMP